MSNRVASWDGERMMDARLAIGLTRLRLGALMNVSEATLYMWETGRRSPDARHLVEVARHLGVATTQLAPMPDPPTLRSFREHSGLTLSELAAMLGTSHSKLSVIERGAAVWPTYADRWAQALNISEDEFRAAWQASTVD